MFLVGSLFLISLSESVESSMFVRQYLVFARVNLRVEFSGNNFQHEGVLLLVGKTTVTATTIWFNHISHSLTTVEIGKEGSED